MKILIGQRWMALAACWLGLARGCRVLSERSLVGVTCAEEKFSENITCSGEVLRLEVILHHG